MLREPKPFYPKKLVEKGQFTKLNWEINYAKSQRITKSLKPTYIFLKKAGYHRRTNLQGLLPVPPPHTEDETIFCEKNLTNPEVCTECCETCPKYNSATKTSEQQQSPTTKPQSHNWGEQVCWSKISDRHTNCTPYASGTEVGLATRGIKLPQRLPLFVSKSTKIEISPTKKPTKKLLHFVSQPSTKVERWSTDGPTNTQRGWNRFRVEHNRSGHRDQSQSRGHGHCQDQRRDHYRPRNDRF